MITITLQSENGADARLELLGLLGLTEAPAETIFEWKNEEKPAISEEPVKNKRRTKAEIEADKKAVEPTIEQANEGESETTKIVVFPTLQDLQRECAILVRGGFKQQGIDIIKNIGGADTSKDVAEDKRQACIDELIKVATENNVAR